MWISCRSLITALDVPAAGCDPTDKPIFLTKIVYGFQRYWACKFIFMKLEKIDMDGVVPKQVK